MDQGEGPSEGGGGSPDWAIPAEDVEVVQGDEGVIGRGALGEVRRGIFQGVSVALKTLHLLRTDAASVAAMGTALTLAERRAQMVVFQKECDLLRRAVHPNIVPFVGVVVVDREPLYLATQYVPSGTLHDLIHSEKYAPMRTDKGRLPLSTQLLVNSGLFSALSFLATLPMIHRDVKPANILARVQDSQLQKVLLADFGEAKELTRTMTVRTMAGTPVYMAPEMAAEADAKGPKCDVFSAGVVMVEMSAGAPPRPRPRTAAGWERLGDLPRRRAARG